MTQPANTQTTPIAIVGGGPVGLMLALFLDHHGTRSVVFNQEVTVRPHPKGSTHNARTMEHYRRLGFAAAIRALGLPPDHPTDVAYFTRFNAWEMARLPMPSEEQNQAARLRSPATDQVPEPLHRANQMYVEQVLFEQDADGVTLNAIPAEGGGAGTWRADYLVGCDGRRSSVRRALGFQYVGYETLKRAFFGGRMISSHVRTPTLYRDFLGDRRAFQYWAINPELRIALVALNGVDKTGLYPVNHAMVVRRTLLERHPWIALNILAAFQAAKAEAACVTAGVLDGYVKTGLADAGLIGALAMDPMPYGVKAARPVLETVADYVYQQGLSPHRVRLEDVFAPSVMEV